MAEETNVLQYSQEKVAYDLHTYIYRLVYHSNNERLSKEQHLELYKECLRAVQNPHK